LQGAVVKFANIDMDITNSYNNSYIHNNQSLEPNMKTIHMRSRALFITGRNQRGWWAVAENYIEAEKDYMLGMKYKDIAAKYGVTVNTVKSWKSRYKWNRKNGEKSVHTKMHTKKGSCTGTTEQI